MDESVLHKKLSLEILGLPFSSKFDWALTFSLSLKVGQRHFEPSFIV